ncbi:olfactory receptor 10A6-like [Acomys russatus]|uniref:olfactory receptor 10A6-like n=1 Tax=Acomys russatus TaxID=60746 RepID=UPI0021E3311B|nr:olfactory receptor 10A6-like [Acomys russatus]
MDSDDSTGHSHQYDNPQAHKHQHVFRHRLQTFTWSLVLTQAMTQRHQHDFRTRRRDQKLHSNPVVPSQDLTLFLRTTQGSMTATRGQNDSSVSEFILLGFSNYPELQGQMFGAFLAIYLVTLTGNTLIMSVILLDRSLHIPMYLFLQNLSVVETGFSTAIMPEMLVVLTTEKATISFGGCFAQMYFILLFGGTECFLLGAMAYDRFAAICHPLSYPVIMSKSVFMKLVTCSWLSGTMMTTLQTTWVSSFPYCGPNEINHISCETPAVLELACTDIFFFEIYAFTGTILIILTPFLLILLSYTRILFAILRMPSTTGRQRAFSTCASHLTSVTLFYSTASMTYLQPKSGYSPDTKKLMSLSYSLLTPLLNPLIYSLRNKEMKRAVVKLWERKVCLHTT